MAVFQDEIALRADLDQELEKIFKEWRDDMAPQIYIVPIVVTPFTARCWSALFCPELVAVRELLPANMLCKTCATCCGSAFFTWRT